MRVPSTLPNLGDALGQAMSPFVVLTCCLRSVHAVKAAEPRTDEAVKNVVEVTWMLNKFSTNEHCPGMANGFFDSRWSTRCCLSCRHVSARVSPFTAWGEVVENSEMVPV